MLKLHCLTLGDFQTNCYILHEASGSRCCIVDPGYEPNIITRYLEENRLEPEAILLTHGHFDHVGAVKALAADFDCDVYISAEDLSLPPMITAGQLYYTHTYPAEGTLTIAGMNILVVPTPGHTPGSVCLLVEDAMISGDTLFAGSCGRTDLPGGSRSQIRASLKKLSGLKINYQVFPGHGDSTTLFHEKQYNPYM